MQSGLYKNISIKKIRPAATSASGQRCTGEILGAPSSANFIKLSIEGLIVTVGGIFVISIKFRVCAFVPLLLVWPTVNSSTMGRCIMEIKVSKWMFIYGGSDDTI